MVLSTVQPLNFGIASHILHVLQPSAAHLTAPRSLVFQFVSSSYAAVPHLSPWSPPPPFPSPFPSGHSLLFLPALLLTSPTAKVVGQCGHGATAKHGQHGWVCPIDVGNFEPCAVSTSVHGETCGVASDVPSNRTDVDTEQTSSGVSVESRSSSHQKLGQKEEPHSVYLLGPTVGVVHPDSPLFGATVIETPTKGALV